VCVCVYTCKYGGGLYVHMLKFNAEFVHNRLKFSFLAWLLIVLCWRKSPCSYCKLLPGTKHCSYFLFPFLEAVN